MKTASCFLFLMLSLFAMPSASSAGEGVFRHIVLFQFKEGTPDETVKKIETEFAALPSKINVITGFEWGPVDNVEPLNDGFTHGFVVTFKDKKGLETYLPHEAHQAFVALLKPHLEKVLVFDFSPQS
jgi:hypothetical protein